MPNLVRSELIPEFIDTRLPDRTRLRCCFDAPLMSGDVGQLLLARHAAQCGDIEHLAQALEPGCPGAGSFICSSSSLSWHVDDLLCADIKGPR